MSACQGTKYVSGHKHTCFCPDTIVTTRLKHVRAQMCLGTNMCGHNRVWAQTCVGTIVSGHKRAWAQSCLGTIVSEHNRVWAQSCLGTIVSGHNRVGTIVWAQVCMGTIEWSPHHKCTFHTACKI